MTDNNNIDGGQQQRRDNNNNNNNNNSAAAAADATAAVASAVVSVSTLRSSIRKTYPEIDQLYSDGYLLAVISVPNRTYEYARDEKIIKALQWRREYQVNMLTNAFRYDIDYDDDDDEISGRGGIFRCLLQTTTTTTTTTTSTTTDNSRSDDDDDDNNNYNNGSSQQLFTPSQSLIDVCLSGAFFFVGIDEKGRGILHSRTRLIDWWETGVEDGIRYHILVIEHALKVLSSSSSSEEEEGGKRKKKKKKKKINNNKHDNGGQEENDNDDNDNKNNESLVLYVDTSGLGMIPPPPTVFTEMAKLMQRAYPDRIDKIYIGPVNGMLRKLYEMISPYLRPRSRDKIHLLDCVPRPRIK